MRNQGNFESVSFMTSDDVSIAANFFSANSDKAVILVHQFNRDKSSWGQLPSLLQQSGFGVLAIDLRGHGESAASGSLASPASLKLSDFQDMEKDLDASVGFLKQKGFSDFFLIGSSIGANWAIMFPASHSGFRASVALSPGLDFKSLAPLSAAKKTRVPLLLIASSDDSYSFDSSQQLFRSVSAPKDFWALKNLGHGVTMLESDPALNQKIVDWLKTN